MKSLWMSALLVSACTSEPIVLPSPSPPPPWGAPISGGTMLVTRDGRYAVIADPDRDRILAVELASERVVTQIALEPGDEPGRVIEDGSGRLHVALRRGGAFISLDNPTATFTRRAVCAEPRGLAAELDVIHVACTSGELVTFPAAGGEAIRRVQLDRDLRDVVTVGGQLVVSRFRSAELLALDANGAVASRTAPPVVKRRSSEATPIDAIPAVAWRTIALADGTLAITHQRQAPGITTQPGGYSEDNCAGRPSQAALTIIPPNGEPQAVHPRHVGALPVDIAARADGGLAVLYASGDFIAVLSPASLRDRDRDEEENCPDDAPDAAFTNTQLGIPTAIAYAPNNDLLAYYPELPALVVHAGTASHTIVLPGPTGYDSGRALFHRQTGSGLACASCHPEAREDGLVWDFQDIGPRRTQSLSGGILARAPFHWTGDMTDLSMLLDNVFMLRMGGGAITNSARQSLGAWLDRIPAAAPVVGDPLAVERGRALFDSTEVGCADCHSGAIYSNSRTFNVGTGQFLKVPSLLGLATRAPYLHDGCAATLLDRFGWCGGGDQHGRTSQLSADQLADLVAFLDSL